MSQVSFHIRDGITPEWCYQYLDILDRYPEASSGKEVYELAEDYGYEVGFQSEREVPTLLKKMEVLETATSLTDCGEELLEVMYYDMNLFSNILHHLFYTRDRIDAATGVPLKDREMSSWAYAAIIDYLIDNSPYEGVSLKKSRQEISNAVYDRAQDELPSLQDEVSIGPRSVSGALQFLTALSPSVITEDTHANNEDILNFEVRNFAPGEMLLLAVDARYQQTETEYGTALILNEETVNALCRTLILDESGLDKVLEWASEYDQFELTSGVSRQVRLSERITFTNLM